MCEMFVKRSMCKAIPIMWGGFVSVPWAALAHVWFVRTLCLRVVQSMFVRALPKMGVDFILCRVEWCAFAAVNGGLFLRFCCRNVQYFVM